MEVLAVGIGGFLGAILRYLVGMWMPAENGFPFATLSINLLGCLFLSWFFTATNKRLSIHPYLKLSIGTGFTGAFTTFSTFSVETLNLINQHKFLIALLYVLISIVGGIALAVAGTKLAEENEQSPTKAGGEIQ